MGLDMCLMGKAKPGYKARFNEIYQVLIDEE